ncbi:uncharacterized protein B0I36DRAFT_382523 [Microdochium trichocladiopsis]|uniref:BTB domain-containing protein n=1 Tax=Microdochium trichocladiopsis TaxID=1682393 RepID=A0A9P9BTT0_9PEZI|nr:uncharacterized protein B0I36DRAFT_382523 [Microdochium trichocladiopsis]KAH7035909.1 hypothetical protein B0I36DRAFT_382523 [Microdochium trichocladiopsis]
MANDTVEMSEHHQIASNTDLTIHILPEGPRPKKGAAQDAAADIQDAAGKKKVVIHEVIFHVEKAVLVRTEYFRVLLQGRFREAGQPSVTLRGDDAHAVGVWFRILHETDLEETYAATTIGKLWEVVAVAKKYGFEPTQARSWFTEWYKRNESRLFSPGSRYDINNLRMLLLPGYVFDESTAFLQVTKTLAYNFDGHITEARPTDVRRDLHVPANFIQQLNAAKGRLRNILHKELYLPIRKLLMASCGHKEHMLFAYEKKLFASGAWPLEQTGHRNSIRGLLQKLKTVDNDDMPESCQGCAVNVSGVICEAAKEVNDYFDGLCLDCINVSKLRDNDDDYWHHASMGPWDLECRVDHGEPTWYFSFMGRREHMTAWLKKRRVRRQQLRGWDTAYGGLDW